MQIDVFWSFRSPWSYLATPRLLQWTRDYQLDVALRPVYPIAIRTPEFFSNAPQQWQTYFMTDLYRVAEFLQLKLVWPDPDPVLSVRDADGQVSFPEPQPHIHRLTRLGVLAQEAGAGIPFADAVSRLIFGGTVNWHEGSHLADATARAGLDLQQLDERAVAEAGRLQGVIEDNQNAHAQAGHWGVPTCVYNGEPFFGQDRLDVLLWRLQSNGLRSV